MIVRRTLESLVSVCRAEQERAERGVLQVIVQMHHQVADCVRTRAAAQEKVDHAAGHAITQLGVRWHRKLVVLLDEVALSLRQDDVTRAYAGRKDAKSQA